MTEGGEWVALVVEISPKPGAELCCFPLKKFFTPKFLILPGFPDHLEKIGRNLALKTVRGPRIPKRPGDFSAKVPRFSVFLGPVSLSLSEVTRCQLPTSGPLARGAAGHLGLQFGEFMKFLTVVVFLRLVFFLKLGRRDP